MKLFTLFLALLISEIVFCQSGRNAYKDFEIGVSFSPDYSYRALRYSYPNEQLADERNEQEQPLLGFTAGISYRRAIKDRLSIESGIFYSVKGERTKTTELHWVTPDVSYPVSSRTVFRYNFAEIPLKLRYVLHSGAIAYFVSAGVGMNLFTQKKTRIITEFEDDKHAGRSSVNAGYARFNVATLVGAGARYSVNRQVNVTAEPYFRRFQNSVTVDENAKEFPYSFGMNLALNYTPKKRK